MLHIFLEWVRTTDADLRARGFGTEITEGEASDNPGAWLDIDTPTAAARVTCWDSGDYFAEILDRDSAEMIYCEHGYFGAGEAISEQLRPFFSALGGASE